ncbi:lipopolysaccharide biosynthesis protein [Sphingobium lactosutens]|uniref:GumC family protein n=1 Tax=Sphingobium lactosutens TaxID=522773 RepID=UPI0015B80DA0|nr:lipopolysaccharide biosynthesis protein [Sphingobium lactosutens]NWK95860.1 lipopolysaccharide biosynthesis protein [Sphingobium lactosutens]
MISDVAQAQVRPEGAFITVTELLAIAYRRRWWIIAPLALGLIAAITAILTINAQYRSTATLLIASQEIPTTLVASPLTNYADERIAKIRQQILSRANLDQLIRTMRLYPEESKRLTADEVQNLMRKAISVELVGANEATHGGQANGKTIAFSLSFTYDDPVVAQVVTERLTHMFLEEDKRLRTEQASGTADFLLNRGNEIRDRLMDLQKRRREIEARYQGALPEQVALSTQAASALRAEVSRIDAETQGIFQQNGILAARSQDIMAAPTSQGEALRLMENRLAQLSATYSDSHPDVVAARMGIENQLADIRATASPRAGGGVIGAEIAAGRARMGMLAQRRSQLVGSISDMEHLSALAPQASYELNNLEREYANLTLQYQDIREKQMEAQVAANLQAEDKGERFTIVDAASLPTDPVFPDRQKLLIGGAAAGLALGIIFIAAVEFSAGLIHGDAAIERLTGIPSLAVIPDPQVVGVGLIGLLRPAMPRIGGSLKRPWLIFGKGET